MSSFVALLLQHFVTHVLIAKTVPPLVAVWNPTPQKLGLKFAVSVENSFEIFAFLDPSSKDFAGSLGIALCVQWGSQCLEPHLIDQHVNVFRETRVIKPAHEGLNAVFDHGFETAAWGGLGADQVR